MQAAALDPHTMDQWEKDYERCKAVIRETLAFLPEETLSYADTLRLYMRVPFLLVAWHPNVDVRQKLSCVLCQHIIGMKFLDDLIDNDRHILRIDAGCANLHLNQQSIQRLSEYPRFDAVLQLLSDEIYVGCKGEVQNKRHPAKNFAQWNDQADIYGGGFLRIYGRIAALVNTERDCLSESEDFAFGFGKIITVADQLTDYIRDEEREGNLGYLLISGHATETQILELLRDMERLAIDACHRLPPTYDLVPIVTFYKDDVINRIIPQLMQKGEVSQLQQKG
jgi:hypothetical protein